jgi:xanthine dehydrogenase YagR molybdenum-binding subunit
MAIVVTSVSAPLSNRSRTNSVEFDGRAKVTAEATYAAEFPASDLANAAVIGSTIAKGRIMRVDSSQASRVAGVSAVLTPR